MKLPKNKQSYFIVFLLCFLQITQSFSQNDDTNDLENWSSIGLKFKLNKKWNFELQEQLRLDENISKVSEYFTQLEASYSLLKNLELGAGMRYIRENDNVGNIQGYKNYFRFNFDATYKHKIDDFSIKYRLRYQNKNELGISTSEGDYANQHLRFKTSVGYNINNWKLDPKISGEIYNGFENGKETEFDKYRLTLGTDYDFKKLGTIGLFYRFEKELNQTIPEITNIIGLKYTYIIKNKSKK